jgi:eukaryotic-like serine/threonine-protein kinase
MSAHGGEPRVLGKRYELLNELGAGGMGKVFRAHDRLTGQTIALKRVLQGGDDAHHTSSAPTEDNELRLALAQEFRVLASLRHPHIVSVLDYGFDAERVPFFTMELLENAQPIDTATEAAPLDDKIVLLVQMLQALVYLHRRGVLHRDLKPNNVLVSNGAIKLVDFGLALFEDTADTTLGTLPYMPPELLYGKRADERADLWGVGLIAYEIMTGAHPFESENRAHLIHNIVNNEPDLTRFEPSLRVIIQRLLQKNPDARFRSAASVIDALRTAADLTLPTETSATRESFLQAAGIIGREAEYARLNEALTATLGGRGGVWLVGGESGVGKSRLLDELRTAALVRGALVIRGQTVSEGASPYSLWLEPLRYLAMVAEPDALEASILKPLIANIAALLGRDVDDAPALDPEAAQARLLNAIESMLRRLPDPLLIILEDLHFAGGESLALFNRLARVATRLPVMVIGSYRDDERPSLPREVPQATRMKLERLPREAIGTVAQAMLGSVGRNADLVELLDRETQGNLFFIIEVVRALAEQAGELSRITEVNLHRRVLTGGVRQIIQRRLDRVPQNARPLLRAAAAAGRQIDLAVLRQLSPQTDLEQWLNQCAEIALAAQEDDWIFAHDKLREALLDDMNPDETRDVHGKIAAAIEAAHDPNGAAARLTYHWAMAGDPTKEGRYAAIAGEQAYQNGAWSEAVTLLGRAYALRNALDFTPMETAKLLRLSADASYRQGNFDDAKQHLHDAAAALDWALPETRAAQSARLMQEVARQVGHRVSPLLRRSPRSRDWLLETNRLSLLEAEIAFLSNETLPMLVHGVAALNQAESAGISPELARGSANMSYAIGNIGQRRLAAIYKRQARRVAEQLGDPSVQEFALRRTSLFDIGLGNWAEGESALEQALTLAGQVGDVQAREESLDFLASLTYYRADYVRSRDLFAQVYASAQRTHNLVHQAWGLLGQAQNDLRLGNLDSAAGLLQSALNILEEQQVNDLVTLIQAYGLLAVVELYRGRREAAGILARQGIERIGKSEPTGFALLEGYAGATEVYLTVLEAANASDPARPALLEQAVDALQRLNELAKNIPIVRPRALLLTGWLAHIEGETVVLREKLNAALREALKLGMPLEVGLAHYRLACALPETDPAYGDHIRDARAVFASLGATHHAALVEAMVMARG